MQTTWNISEYTWKFIDTVMLSGRIRRRCKNKNVEICEKENLLNNSFESATTLTILAAKFSFRDNLSFTLSQFLTNDLQVFSQFLFHSYFRMQDQYFNYIFVRCVNIV
jgi:hypothetical protein